MRLLIVTEQRTYLRHFEEVVLELAARGHEIDVASPATDKVVLSDALKHAMTQLECPVQRSDEWADVIKLLRATRSYTRYWNPVFADSPKLRRRAFRKMAAQLTDGKNHLVGRCPHCELAIKDELLTEMVQSATAEKGERLSTLGRLIEAAVPADPDISRFIQSRSPDLVVVTPLVQLETFLPDYVKSAKTLGIPTLTPIFSWDNLSNKGLMHVVPDQVLVWNDTQRREAIDLHDVPAEQVVVTGAPRFDPFVAMQPSVDRSEFCAANGFDPTQLVIAYLGSSQLVTPDERSFVEPWVRALRGASDPRLAGANLFLRPHPRQRHDWLAWDISDWGRVQISISDYQNADQQLYDALHYSAAAVALNTSAAIEAALVGTPVFSVLVPEYDQGQRGTVHFHYLLEEQGGCMRVAASLDEHVDHLARLLDGDQDATRDRNGPFVETFVNGGLSGQSATERMVETIEQAASGDQTSPASSASRSADS